jgi:hypothetical protein
VIRETDLVDWVLTTTERESIPMQNETVRPHPDPLAILKLWIDDDKRSFPNYNADDDDTVSHVVSELVNTGALARRFH